MTRTGGLRLLREDVTLVDVDALVFYARHDLVLGSGFGNAISSRGGQEIQRELDDLAPVETCDVVVSGAGELTANHILHAVGPRFQEEDTDAKLRKTIRSVLETANGKGLKSLALPPMGAGYYGIPLPDCAKAMVEEIRAHLSGATSLEDVVICAGDRREQEPFEALLGKGE
ncbi:MAG: macro domain-containing protein [Planctomycetota bacterium]